MTELIPDKLIPNNCTELVPDELHQKKISESSPVPTTNAGRAALSSFKYSTSLHTQCAETTI